ncbi:hypothetical protein M9Y10_022416 [Tritrichomonas musculus]|uniref:Uncharacterized protein n=1 Tax=Tritrichomonas musculus TaxID=1915356 RepID=A0ABR2KT66_9EUKA
MRKKASARTSRLNIEADNFLFADDIPHIAAQIMRGKKLSNYPLDILQEVLSFLQVFKQKVIESKDYMYAQEIEDKINQLNVFCTKSSYEQQQELSYDCLCRKLRNIEHDLEEAKMIKNEFIESFNIEKQNALDMLLQKQQGEIEELDEEIKKGIPYQFNKYSSEYLNQRKKEKSLVSAKFYLAAYYMKKDTDKLQIQENKQMQINWYNYNSSKKDYLMKQHQQQIDCLNEKFEKTFLSNILILDAEIDKFNAAYATTKLKIDTIKYYNSPGTRQTSQRTIVKVPSQNVSSRMTRMRTSNYQLKEKDRVLTCRPRTAIY